MKTTHWTSLIGLSLLAPAALAVSTWGVGDFLDGSNASTLQAQSAYAYSTTGTGATLAASCIHNYGTAGYGIVNTAEANPCTGEPGTGPHAADNVGETDLFALRFSSAVNLSQVTIGWNGTDNFSADSDISVLRYDGVAALPTISGLTLTGLLGSGWTVVGNYANVGSLAGNSTSVSSTQSSSWWLISAYNSGFGTTATNGGTLGNSNDYFKLLSVAGTVTPPPPGVPEPGSLALFALALAGALRFGRRAIA